jgi:phosphonate transport system permease protein
LASGMKNATPAFLRVMWPWEEAITYPEDILSGSANIQVPCTDVPFPETSALEDTPYIIVSPTCGDLSTLEGSEALGRLDGTALHLEGYNFLPGVEGIVWWMDPNRQTFRQREGGGFVYVTPDEDGYFEVDITMPYRLIGPSAADEAMVWIVSVEQVAAVGSPVPSEALVVSAELIIETIIMGMMATIFGVVLAVPVSFIAARNLMGSTSITLAIYYVVRGALNIIRSIEPLIWAVIATIAVGLGPYAGILALTLHSVAALGKLYSESIESIDNGPIEAIQATGANWLQTVMYAVVPQIVPPFVSFTIYRWDINVRMSTIIGLAGGGGIGFVLLQWIHKTDYDSAGIAVWFIAITVAILDYVSAEIRARYV